MTEQMPSRRALLRYCAAGSIAGLAGCLWGNSDDTGGNGTDDGTQNGTDSADDGTDNGTDDGGAGNGADDGGAGNGADDGSAGNGADDGSPGNGGQSTDYSEAFELAGDGASLFRDWVIPGNQRGTQGGVTSVCAYRNFESPVAEEVESIATYRQNIASSIGSEPESLSGELIVGAPDSQGQRQIRLGEFDVDAIVDHLSENTGVSFVDEFRGYSVFEGQEGGRGAIGPDAILSVSNYEEYIDANRGDRELLAAADPDVGFLFDVLPTGLQISVSRHDDLEDLAINGSTRHDLDENGNPNRVTRAFVFHDAEDATVERAREIISIGQTGFEEILNEQQHERMVMTEFIQDWPS